MGGLRKSMPLTFITMLCACLAISGFPFTSGFFSKDAILAAAYEHAPWMFWVGVITAGMTAFYVFRAFFLTFFGSYRGHHHPHESPFVITLPLIVLAVLSLGGGFLNVPAWLSPLFPQAEGHENPTVLVISVSAGLIGIFLAYLFYVAKPALAESAANNPLHGVVANKYYVDEIYNALIVKPTELISRYFLWKGVDDGLIDGTVNAAARSARGLGGLLRYLQSGSIRNYAAWVMAGSLLLIVLFTMTGGRAQ